jgi:hypothetical protein
MELLHQRLVLAREETIIELLLDVRRGLTFR